MSLRLFIEEIKSSGVKVYAVFSGRFQPFTKGHADAIDIAMSTIGDRLDRFFILTSDKVDGNKTLSFEERKILITAGTKKHADKIEIKELHGSPYTFDNIIKNIGIQTSEPFLLVYVSSDEDAGRIKTNITISSPVDVELIAGRAAVERRKRVLKQKLGDSFKEDQFIYSVVAKLVPGRATQKDERISGTRVRKAIQDGDWDEVQSLVPYTIDDKIKHLLSKFVVRPTTEALHLPHMEKVAASPSKFLKFVDVLEKLVTGDKGLIVTQKIDGRPVIMFGKMDDKFFVGMKDDVMRRKILFTMDDIEKHYSFDPSKGEGKEEMMQQRLKSKITMFEKLRESLSKLSIPNNTAYSADVLFYPGFGSKQVKDGMYAMKPNTTWYIATNKESSDKIKEAEVGVAVHTKFSISDSKFSTPKSVTKATSGLNEIKEVFIPNTKLEINLIDILKHDIKRLKETEDKKEVEALLKKIKSMLLTRYNKVDLRAEVTESDDNNVIVSDKGEGLVVDDPESGMVFKIVDIEKFANTAADIHEKRREKLWGEEFTPLFEGGNVAVKVGDKWVGAEKIDVQKYGRENVKSAIKKILFDINKRLNFCDNSIIEDGSILAGSGGALFNDKISDEDFVKFKPKVGDIDVQVDQDFKHELVKILKPNSKIGGATYLGAGEKALGEAAQINTIFILPIGEGIKAQFDFEFVEYDKKTKQPSAWSRFSHSSSWRDTEQGIKGVLHKYLLRSIVAGSKRNIKLSTPAGTKISDATVGNLSFSVARGLRHKIVTLEEFFLNKRVNQATKDKVLKNLSKTTGMTPEKLKKEKNIFIELPTSSSEYITDVKKIINSIGVRYNQDDIMSYVGIVGLLKEVEDKVDVLTIFHNFVELMFEQEIENPANKSGRTEDERIRQAAEEDVSAKKAGIDYFVSQFPQVKSEMKMVNSKFRKWQQNYGQRYRRRLKQ